MVLDMLVMVVGVCIIVFCLLRGILEFIAQDDKKVARDLIIAVLIFVIMSIIHWILSGG